MCDPTTTPWGDGYRPAVRVDDATGQPVVGHDVVPYVGIVVDDDHRHTPTVWGVDGTGVPMGMTGTPSGRTFVTMECHTP